VFTEERETALALIHGLIVETADLLEEHLPEVDVKSFRRTYLTKLHPISPEGT
jgi:hypothetical protein